MFGAMPTPLLVVDDLGVEFPRGGSAVRAADGVGFSIARGESLALVGESGSGKSATALALLRLVPPPGRITGGRVLLEGVDLLTLPEHELRRYRGAGLAYVPQEPGPSLNPVLTIGSQIVDVIRAHRDLPRRQAWAEAVSLLGRVGIPDPERRARAYPHEFSGGMAQRALIAMALSARPRILLADEPTTAIDPTLKLGILDLLRRLRDEEGLSILLITHDLGAVAALADRVLVMYAGRIVEEGGVDSLFARPLHPYTRALLDSLPRAGVARGELRTIRGSVPDLARLPSGCAFHPRCTLAEQACRAEVPALVEHAQGRVACIVANRAPAAR